MIDSVVVPSSAVTMETASTNPAEQASGFILKLYEMITGAPDELIRVSDIERRIPQMCDIQVCNFRRT